MKSVIILFLSSLAYSTANPVCSTVETENGSCCVFPFIFGGYKYYSCTSHGWDRDWCSLTSNYDNDGLWGNCEDAPVTTAPPPVVTTIPPSSGGGCGNKPAGSRIVGGIQAQKGEWPWQAMLAQAGGSQFCGGSLISDRWVLTASHCVEGSSASQIVVRMGAHKITDIGEEHQIEQIIMHESYNSPTGLAHDIALLKLKTSVTLGGDVGTVCLPDVNHPLLEGKRCYITGWGTLASGGSQPDYLQEASVPIVSQAKCETAYGANNIHNSMVCAGFDAGGVDSCQGDSGGPMVCEFSGRWFIEGATSWGHGCAAKGKPGVYAKVRYLKGWLENKMNGGAVTTALPPVVTTPPPVVTTAPPPSGGNCGNKPAGSRIVGGIQAQKGEWPWQAMLAQAGGSQFCGGSLISDRWVLTASHCVEGASASQIVVRMGAHKITDIGEEHQIERIIMHDSYNSPTGLAHDIALLKLKTSVTLGGDVGTVCLPDVNHPLLEGKRCYITGWGTLASGGSQPDYLQEASVPIVSQAKCETAYGANNIHNSMVCAGFDAGGVDSCQGDSGGPMVCEFSGTWFIEGATSWGHGCAAKGKPGVYAKVRYLKAWIENKMSSY